MKDLRLVPAALAAWLAAALLVGAPAGAAGGLAAVAVGLAVLLGVLARAHRPASGPSGARREQRSSAEAPPGSVPAPRPASGVPGQLVLVLVAVAAVSASTAGQLAVRGAGPLEGLVAQAAVVELEGTVRSEPAPVASGGVRVELAVRTVEGRGDLGPAAARVLVLGDETWGAVHYGERVRATARLVPAEPGRAVLALARALGPPEVRAPAGPVERTVNELRAGLLEVTDPLPGDARGLVPGLAVGDTTRLDPALAQAMRDVSLTHVTAVSGAHFAIVGAAVLGLVTLLGVPRAGRAAAVLAATVGFVVLVHPEPSVLRAGVMGTIGVLALLLGRPSRAMPALATAVLVLVTVDPWLARSYGFVLSALATAGLVVLARPLAARLERFMPAWLAHALAVPLAAQLACAPVLVLLAPSVALYAVPANLLAAPALVPATVLGVLATLLAPWWPWLAGLLATGAGWACSWLALVARTGAGLPGALVPWPGGPGGALALAGVLLGVGLLVVRARALSRGAWAALGVLVLCLALVVSPAGRREVLAAWPDGWPPPGWRVVLCDVGQGTALVVRSGPRSAVVVDAGPAEGGAGECLDRLGVRRVELLVLSHFHADHVDGLAGVLAGRQVDAALVSPLAEPAPQADAALAALEQGGVPVEHARAGTSGRAGEVTWRVLWPADDVPAAPNDASVVVWLASDGLSVLALGDLETEAQHALARSLRDRGVHAPARVVVMAHHGSARQSAALARLLDPEVLLVPVGADNTYGHPAPGALELYDGALVLRTDLCGPVALTATHHTPC